MKCPLGISNFIEEISKLSYSVVFLYFFALITEKGFLISSCYSLELCIQIFPFLLCFLLVFFSQLFVRPPQTAISLFCISFPQGWMSPSVVFPKHLSKHNQCYHSYSISLSCFFLLKNKGTDSSYYKVILNIILICSIAEHLVISPKLLL